MNLLRLVIAGGTIGNGSGSGGMDAETVSWDQRPELTADFLEEVEYDPSDYTDSEIDDYAPGTMAAANTWPVGATVELPAGTLVRGSYRQTIAAAGAVELLNDVPGRVTPYTVLDGSGKVIAAGALAPTGALRWIKCQTAPNVRDLGGWACDGGSVRYGLILRGGEPGADDVDVLVHQCGMRHELQLRGAEEAPRDYSLLGIGFTTAPGYVWYSVAEAKWPAWIVNLGCVFDRIPSGIPVYAHCSAGADRTGSFICLIEAILGVSQSNIDKDYELTCFYSGTATDSQARRRDEDEWKGLINGILAVALPSGAVDTFRNHAIQFCLDRGFSASQINAFRAAMIDGTPETAAWDVAASGSHAVFGNAAKGALAGAAYSCSVGADAGFEVSAVTVTMGGVDITATAWNAGTGTVSIAAVTGAVSIAATTQVHVLVDLLKMDDGLINKRIPTNGTPSDSNGYFVTDYFTVDLTTDKGLRVVKGKTHMGQLTNGNAYGNTKMCLYDSSKALLCQWYIGKHSQNNTMSDWTEDGDDLVIADITTDHGTCVSGGTIPSDWSTVKFIRLGLALDNAAAAIGSVSDVTGSGMAIYAE